MAQTTCFRARMVLFSCKYVTIKLSCWVELPSWKMDMTSQLRCRSANYYEIWQTDVNEMTMTTPTSKSKPEIKFKYGGRRLSETGSSFISAADWDISLKFDRQIDFHLFKQMPLLSESKSGSRFLTLWPPSWKIRYNVKLRRRSSH